MPSPLVALLMGSRSDWPYLEPGAKMLDSLGIPYDVRALSAHRSPRALVEYVEAAPGRGVEVFIAAAGGAAHLPGVVAAHTLLPVLGVPVETQAFGGLDSLLSIVQMPT
ncbi:phosphoribosylaminoimidazole carboxylase catalytic subunit, partial [mine drainage metagenome]